MATDSERIDAVLSRFRELFGDGGRPRLFRAPGRVNIIGEHTDYNGGFVLPIAIERSTLVACRPSKGKSVRIFSLNFEEMGTFSLQRLHRDEEKTWLNYPQGVADCLQKEGHELMGMDCVVEGNVPIGGGLSSSASIEVVFGLAFCALSDVNIERKALALLCQRAENEFVGVSCGIMDQYVSLLAEKGHAVLIDCKNLSHELVPIPEGSEFVICNTGVKRELAGSAYNERRADCEEAARILGVEMLRDITVADLRQRSQKLPERIAKRARHVVTEDERTMKAVQAMKADNLEGVGEQMYASHESLRVDYEVTCSELDLMVEIARCVEGTHGARMTGAGFGGCTVNLVEADAVRSFISTMKTEYKAKTGLDTPILVTSAEAGAGEIEL